MKKRKKKRAPNHPGKRLHSPTFPHSPPPPNGQCPYGNNIFQKGASLITMIKLMTIRTLMTMMTINAHDDSSKWVALRSDGGTL